MNTKHARCEHLDEYVRHLRDLRVGQSCFFVGLKRADVEFLRRPALAAGIRLVIQQVACDEIHMVAGVRVWRESGPYDEL